MSSIGCPSALARRIALYVWAGLIASLVTPQFCLQAGDVFDVGRAIRSQPRRSF